MADHKEKRDNINRKKDSVGRKISKLRHEGKSPSQAVAIAKSMERRGEL